MFGVYIVEDSILVRKEIIVTMNWNKLNCIVIGSADNAETAYNEILVLQPEIVITDIRLPNSSGLELIGKIKKTEYLPEFIVISAYSEFEYAKKAISLGVNNYLLKPIDEEEFESTVEKVTQKIKESNVKKVINESIIEQVEKNTLKFDEIIFSHKSNFNKYLKKTIDIISQEYMNDLSLGYIANQLGISKRYITKLFKSNLKTSFTSYLSYYRIRKAIQLLKETDMYVYEVAQAVGYRDYRHFGVVFKKLVGITPKEFKEYEKL